MLSKRDELIAALFRETDRAQRMKTALAVVLFGIDDWAGWQRKLEKQELAEVEQEITARTARLLRCYDMMQRYSDGEFGLVLPGCNSFNAVGMAERLRLTVFGTAIRTGHRYLTLSACYGIAGSGGRSPLVVLRNAENAISKARACGAGSIERSSYDSEPDPAMLLMPVIEDEALHW